MLPQGKQQAGCGRPSNLPASTGQLLSRPTARLPAPTPPAHQVCLVELDDLVDEGRVLLQPPLVQHLRQGGESGGDSSCSARVAAAVAAATRPPLCLVGKQPHH